MNSTHLSKTKLTIQILTNKKCQEVVELLKGYQMDVKTIEHNLKISQSETSQRLARLRSIGLVNTNRVGKNIYYSLNKERYEFLENLLILF